MRGKNNVALIQFITDCRDLQMPIKKEHNHKKHNKKIRGPTTMASDSKVVGAQGEESTVLAIA
jgi:hypothetical protein